MFMNKHKYIYTAVTFGVLVAALLGVLIGAAPASADDTIYVLCHYERRISDSQGLPCFLIHDTSIGYFMFMAKDHPRGETLVVRVWASDTDLAKIRASRGVTEFASRQGAIDYCTQEMGYSMKLLRRF